ncbi:hypothetical protein [Sphingomonas sp. R-74633]|nr:hypothetical protein [Sphingomonas sp. R-74633]
MIVVLLLVVAIFLGLNLSHYQEMKQGAAVGNASGVPGPGGGS